MHRLLKRLIIFLIRKRLGLKKGEQFRFANQASEYNTYYFDKDCMLKNKFDNKEDFIVTPSSVSLNWLLDDRCDIVKVKEGDTTE
jgi:hypothetical protein